MAYLWNHTLETGSKLIDEQHRRLFEALNNIAAAFQEGRGAQEVSKTIAFLTDYTIMHFETEEELMKKHKYLDYSAHKFCHEDFKKTVGSLTKKLEKEGPSEDLIVNVTAVVGDWLISHIKFDDIKMITDVKSKIESDGFTTMV